MRSKWAKIAISLVLILGLAGTFGLVGCSEDEEPTPTPTPVVEADFSASATLGKAPLAVVFTDESTGGGGVSGWAWDFDSDGTVDDTTQHPSYTYDTAGIYTVSLTVTGSDGSDDTEVMVGYIRVGDLLAGFTAAPTSGIIPVAVQFTDESVGTITGWAWDFGDDGTSTVQNPSHTYATAGTYTVSLTVTAAEGTDTYTGVTIQAGAVPELEAATWKLSHGFPETSTRGKAALKLKELIEEVTDGKITVDVFPSSTLFSPGLAVNALQTGTVDITYDPPYYWTSVVPMLKILYITGFMRSYDHARYVYEDPTWLAEMQEAMDEFNVHVLGHAVDSMWSLYVTNERPLHGFEDLHGLRTAQIPGATRSPSQIYGETVPVPLPYMEWLTAFQTGAIDVYAASASTFVGMSVWEWADYGLGYWMPGGSTILMNQDTWDDLPAYWQDVMTDEVMPEILDFAYDETVPADIVYWDTLVENMVDATFMTDEQTLAMVEEFMTYQMVKSQMWDAGEAVLGVIDSWQP